VIRIQNDPWIGASYLHSGDERVCCRKGKGDVLAPGWGVVTGNSIKANKDRRCA
jgi:hypothetical protein